MQIIAGGVAPHKTSDEKKHTAQALGGQFVVHFCPYRRGFVLNDSVATQATAPHERAQVPNQTPSTGLQLLGVRITRGYCANLSLLCPTPGSRRCCISASESPGGDGCPEVRVHDDVARVGRGWGGCIESVVSQVQQRGVRGVVGRVMVRFTSTLREGGGEGVCGVGRVARKVVWLGERRIGRRCEL